VASEEAQGVRRVESGGTVADGVTVRRFGDFVIYTRVDDNGELIGETALPMTPMFTDKDLIAAGFMTAD
jgi:hypothetical protein